jgi:hypothetical protein
MGRHSGDRRERGIISAALRAAGHRLPWATALAVISVIASVVADKSKLRKTA